MAAPTTALADPSLRYTSMLLGRLATNQPTKNSCHSYLFLLKSIIQFTARRPLLHVHVVEKNITLVVFRVRRRLFCFSKSQMSSEMTATPIWRHTVSVSVSAQDGIVALGKAHTRSAPSFSSLPRVALETEPIFAWLNTDRSGPWKVECRPLPFSTPLSFRRSVL